MKVPRSFAAAFLVVAIGLLAANVILASQNAKIRALNSSQRASEHVDVGQLLPGLTGQSLVGEGLSIAYNGHGKGTLILVFDPNCGACLDNAPNWRRLVSAIDRNRVRIIAVGLDMDGLLGVGQPPAVLSAVGLDSTERVLIPAGSSVFNYRLRLTPQTILVGPGGHVRGEWDGVLAQPDIQRLRALIRDIAPFNDRAGIANGRDASTSSRR